MNAMFKCLRCSLIVEGLYNASTQCPKCKEEMKVIATYPKINENTDVIQEGQVSQNEV